MEMSVQTQSDLLRRNYENLWLPFYLKVELVSPGARMPVRANSDDAGMDVFAPTEVRVYPGMDSLVPLGWRCEFPPGFAMIFKEKSGLATKAKLDVGACVVDAGYRGIVHVHLFNNSPNQTASFKAGDKLAQFVIVPVWHGDAMEVESLDMETSRGEGGFGSTGA